MVKFLTILKGLFIIVIATCGVHMIMIAVDAYGTRTTLMESFERYRIPFGVAAVSTLLFNLVEYFLQWEINMTRYNYVVVFVQPSGECWVELKKMNDDKGGFVIRTHNRLPKLVLQFKKTYDLAKSIDYQQFTSPNYGFNIMRPHIIRIPEGASVMKWCREFMLENQAMSLTIPAINHTGDYAKVNSAILDHAVLDIVGDISRSVYGK